MRELFEICSKIQFFLKLFWCFLSYKGSEFGRKRCKIVCSYVLGTTLKNSLLKP